MNIADWPLAILNDLHRVDLLHELICRTLKWQTLCNIQLLPSELEFARNTITAKYKLDSPDNVDMHLVKLGLNSEHIFRNAALPMISQRYCRDAYGSKVEAYFLDHKIDFDNIVYSLIRVKESGLANELFLRLDDGESTFAELALHYSEGHERLTRGIVGPSSLSKCHPQLRQVLLSSSPGIVNPPIQIEHWFLIVRLESFMPAKLDDKLRSFIENLLFQQDIIRQASAIQSSILDSNP